ncbi:MAG: hypothetical protein JJU11_12845 [Candidatus Sumerlaeia bacterium]|nr:hypothetical protein [Candidatus Sumerlaeia bacterium]
MDHGVNNPQGNVRLQRAGFSAGRSVVAIMFALLCLAAWRVPLSIFGPAELAHTPPPVYTYSMEPLQEHVSPERVSDIHEEILSFGSRFMGQEGFYRTEEYIRNLYEEAGLEVYVQTNKSVVPVTEKRRFHLLDDDREVLQEDVELFPFLPNHLQPVATPEGGLRGELVLMTREVLESRASFENCIALIDARDHMTPSGYNFDWSRYAQLGIKGVIVSHPDGLESVPWGRVASDLGGMVSSIPVNYPRLAASHGIFDHVGREVRIDIRSRFQQVEHRSIFGVLRAGHTSRERPNEEALLVLTNYDASSILPDSAPGTMQAIPLATQLAIARGLAGYRESMVRDVVFVAFGAQFMARDGDNHLMKLIEENVVRERRTPVREFLGLDKGESVTGDPESDNNRLRPWKRRLAEDQQKYNEINTIIGLLERDGFLADAARTASLLRELDNDTNRIFQDQLKYCLNELVFSLHEPVTMARLALIEAEDTAREGDALEYYRQVKAVYDRAVNAAGFSLNNLMTSDAYGSEFILEYNIHERLTERMEELKDHHLFRMTHLSESIELLEVLLPYSKKLVFDNKMVPSVDEDDRREQLSFWDGDWGVKTNMREMSSLVTTARERLSGIHPEITNRAVFDNPDLSRWHSSDVNRHTQPVSNLSATQWTQFGYHKYTFLNFGRSRGYSHYHDPVELPFMRDVASLRHGIATYGELLLSVAHGNGAFAPIQVGWLKKTFGGRVLASGLGQSMVPNHPVQGAVLASRPFFGYEYSYPGFYQHPIIMTDPYGRYELVNTPSDFWVNNFIWAFGFSPVAALHDSNGVIAWMKDEGETGQRLYNSVNLNWFDPKIDDVTLVLFRASPIALLDVTNPQRMSDFTGIRFFESRGVSGLERFCHFRLTPDRGIAVSFVEPDKRVYIGLESGTPENDLARVIRGFLINSPKDWRNYLESSDPSREIKGPGHLAAFESIPSPIPLHLARSMISVNTDRLDLQKKHHMADSQVIAYHERAEEFLSQAEDPDAPLLQVIRDSRDSATYSMLNHPVLRRSLSEAVFGILYYLALLVPFVFFFEKMVFCNKDIRRQLATQIVIFLIVFTALRFLHPAFAMIRSSLMILLGFAVILVAGSITLVFSEKFKENLEELSRRRGLVKSAQANRIAVIGSAFMLGLNNMHRRKLRTALTCGTISLMTFAMISFTSVQTTIVDEEVSVGRAPYQGVLLKKDYFQRFSNAEVFAIESKFGHNFTVAPRRMSLGIQNWMDKRGYNPILEIVHEHGGRTRSQIFNSIIQMTHADPLQEQLEVLVGQPWFTEEQQLGIEGQPAPVLIPTRMAEALGMSIEPEEWEPTRVQINGRTFIVIGVFSETSLAAIRDLDNQDILPYDVESMARIHVMGDGEVLADESSPRIPPHRIVIAPFRDLEIQVANEKPDSNTSIALYLPDADLRTAREEIQLFLEQSERPAYYGLGDIAYRGQRSRRASITGMIDLLIPLLIVALTVMNTMKGSVHERRGEISVYNAVGIAPRHVFFMFIAEALVYAVVGSLLGYLLSQGVGKALILLGLTGGMNMAFTSIATIYASMAIAVAVIVSTWFPARTAMEIAKPAEDAGWQLPEPDENGMTIELPFTFTSSDRIAVLLFCKRFLDDHGDGGSGSFHCLPAIAGFTEEGGQYTPHLETSIWLKPYDLGVSQRLVLAIPPDHQTGEFKACAVLEQLSGSNEAWMRLNRRFVTELRRHLLHWRAVPQWDRDAMYEEARMLFESLREGGANHGD